MNIEIRAISKAYGEQSVLRELSCSFPGGRVSCILGPSGCGKTTLLRLIAGLEKSDSGSISGADGLKISAVFQENRLFEELSAVKNVLLTARRGFDRRAAEEMLAALGLEDPGKKARDCSGGMQRRIAVARALAADYELLLLDEPLSGLDGETRSQVCAYIRHSLGGRSCIWVTHDPEVADFADGTVLRL